MSRVGRLPGRRGAADRIIVGRVATLWGAPDFGWVDALAIRAGRVVAAGSPADVEPMVGPATETWRLAKDQLTMPANTDAHLHLVAAALSAAQPDLTGLDLDRVVAAIAAAHERLIGSGDRKGWLLGHGWSIEALGRRPTAASLDAAAPGRQSRWLAEAVRRRCPRQPHGGAPRALRGR